MSLDALSFTWFPTRSVRPATQANLTTLTDPQLLALIQNKTTQALQVLYDRYAPRAMGLAYKILQDRSLAEEVTQDAFWKVWQHAGEYQASRSAFTTWFFTIVRNLAIDQLRRRKRHVAYDEEQPEGLSENLVSAASSDMVERRLQSDEIQAALEQLPEAQRRVIELAYFEGLTHHEIAEKMRSPIGTIHTRARLGLDKLREILAQNRREFASA